MSKLLQEKDDQWRNRRRNGSVPVFDPGMSPLGTDDEAGGASAVPAKESPARPPLPQYPRGGQGLRAPPRFWYLLAGALVVLLAAVAAWSAFAQPLS